MSKDIENKQQFIRELKEKAEQVRGIIGVYKKRRPIVIEFSGAPKAGKTSSINSLLQFLKRNEFKVTVIQESASMCPVKDKHSPMFNLWTACDTIKSLVGVLESERTQYDVVIIDRGIFDSMCWFQWMLASKRMDHEMKENMDRFLSMQELMSYIDIVFVYMARPDISIEREYASLLTDIPGSIMNETILGEYLCAVQSTVDSVGKKGWFRKVVTIDTSDKDQNAVGKEVTSMTLDILKELFEECVGYIDLEEEIKEKLEKAQMMDYVQFKHMLGDEIELKLNRRSLLEEDRFCLQPIPIAVIKEAATNQVLVVKKASKATGNDSPEKEKFLPYVGGHIRTEDKNAKNANDFLEICKTALKRELREELGISVSLDDVYPDLIYTPDGNRSDLHIAVCFVLTEQKETMKVHIDNDELISNRGRSKSGTFVEPESVAKMVNSWGKAILKHYFGIDQELKQLSLFGENE